MLNFFFKVAPYFVIICMIYGAWAYLQHLRRDLEELKQQRIVMQVKLDQQQLINEVLVNSVSTIQTITHQMLEDRQQTYDDIKALDDLFNKPGRDFENLARKKPGLIEPRVNDSTKSIIKCFEKLSEKGSTSCD